MKNGPIFIIIFVILVIGVELYFYFQERPEAVIKVEKTSQSIPICTIAGTALNFDGTNWFCNCVNGKDKLGKCIIGKDTPSTIINIGARATAAVTTSTSMNIPQCAAPGGLLSYDRAWKCTCKPGYSGPGCSIYDGTDLEKPLKIKVPPCYSPGGFLSSDGEGNWSCNCAIGWSGIGCGTFVDPLSKSNVIPGSVIRCLAPGGNLNFDGVNWTCTCTPGSGWFGKDCGTTDLTDVSIACKKGQGTVKYNSDYDFFSCECVPGFVGCDCSLKTGATDSQIISTCF